MQTLMIAIKATTTCVHSGEKGQLAVARDRSRVLNAWIHSMNEAKTTEYLGT